MAEERAPRALARDAVERMVGVVDSAWRVRDCTPASDGVTPVSHLTVDTPEGTRECVLKAAPGEDAEDNPAVGDIGAEARLLTIVGDQTSIPVPEVLGVVDDDAVGTDEVRTPFFLMESVHGRKIEWSAVGSLPDTMLDRVAGQTGRYLGQLHSIDAPNVQGFGRGLECPRAPTLHGVRPSSDAAQLILPDGYDDFRDQLADWHEADLADLADAQFSDLVPDLRSTLAEYRSGLPDTLEPRLARMDHGWHNLLVDDDAGEIEAVVDWGALCAMPPAFDIALAELYLAGGWWLALPSVPDRRSLVRDALLAEYQSVRPMPAEFERQRECYQLDVLQSWMGSLGEGLASRAIPAARQDEAAAGFRALLGDYLD